MKIGIICGSQRSKSQTAKVGAFIQEQLNTQSIDTFVLDLGKAPLPNFDDSFWYEPQGELQVTWKPISAELKECDGFIVITPDWHGMVPSCLKNFFLFTDVKDMANKPGLIIAISASVGGYLPIAELRISSTKNNRLCWIPDHLIVRNVKQCFNEEKVSDDTDDIYIRARLQHTIDILLEYSKALSSVRQSEVSNYSLYKFGM
ncbi:NADPH-dependent FMN reductase [Paraglaciecola sp. L3A3]|uniref:NADPH-dependent FMN reductase n=1 Tax=Paraglaciecola sp. L3A3 TaxID=2686358 RepID=UPI00131B3241|nr:NAD(P)H-dependent oxidoreductase [Paraglaciecola sp. L3A3]